MFRFYSISKSIPIRWTLCGDIPISARRKGSFPLLTAFFSSKNYDLFSDEALKLHENISPKLMEYIYDCLRSGLQHHFLHDPERVERLAGKVFREINSNPSASLSNQKMHEFGVHVSRCLQQSNQEVLLRYDEGKLSLQQLFQTYQESLIASRNMFETITSHHYSITQRDWEVVTEDTKALRDYSSAAKSMGNRRWVKEANDWMLNYAFTYFRHGNAVKHFMKLHSLKKYDKSHSYQNLSRDLMRSDSDPNPTDVKKIRILDVGSCYNPLVNNGNSNHFDITALDLYPADPSVYQCDFLALQIGSEDSLPIIEDMMSDDQIARKKIIQLPAHSFDVISMSLVLSYLSHPQQRETMIRKARQLLRSSVQTQIPHYNGLLLIVEKESIFSKMKQVDVVSSATNQLYSEWKRAIAAQGFDFAKYSLLSTEGGRKSHAFAFSTKPISQLEEYYQEQQRYNSITFGAASRLWIRQDFVTDYPQGTENSSRSDLHQSVSVETNEKTQENPSVLALGVSEQRPPPIRYYPIGIIGGGLGGSALALALQKKGIPFKLFEKDLSFDARRQGYALTMQQGSIALRELGIVDQVKQLGTISTGHYSYDAQGNIIGAYGAHVSNPSLLPQHQYESILDIKNTKQRHNIHIPRQVLRNLLLTQISPQQIFWNKKLVSIESVSSPTNNHHHSCNEGVSPSIDKTYKTIMDPEPLRLQFQDGSEELVSIVIGADGIFSRVRQLLKLNQTTHSMEEDTSITSTHDLQYLGLMVILGISHMKSSLNDINYCQRQWVNGTTRIFTMPFDSDHVMWQLSYPLSELQAFELSSVEKRNLSEIMSIGALLKEEALQRCRGWDPILREILERTEVKNISGHPVYDRNPSDFIVTTAPLTSRITLLGDAAHPMSPFKGQGANQALLDALSLSKALVSSDFVKPYRRKITVALRDYEQDMISRTTVKVLKSRDAAKYLHSQVALATGNITRAKAAEEALLDNTDR